MPRHQVNSLPMPAARSAIITNCPYRASLTRREIALIYNVTEAEVTDRLERSRIAGHSVLAIPQAWKRAGLERVDQYLTETDSDDLAGFFQWAAKRDSKANSGALDRIAFSR